MNVDNNYHFLIGNCAVFYVDSIYQINCTLNFLALIRGKKRKEKENGKGFDEV